MLSDTIGAQYRVYRRLLGKFEKGVGAALGAGERVDSTIMAYAFTKIGFGDVVLALSDIYQTIRSLQQGSITFLSLTISHCFVLLSATTDPRSVKLHPDDTEVFLASRGRDAVQARDGQARAGADQRQASRHYCQRSELLGLRGDCLCLRS